MVTLIVASHALLGLLSPLSPALSDIPLKAPPGWKTATQSGSTSFTPGDVPEGKVYAVIVTPVTGKAGTLDEIYESAKKMIGEVGTYKALSTLQQAQSDGGWDYKFTIGSVEKNGSSFLAQVMAIKKGEEGGVVLVVSESVETMQKYADPFANMIRSLGGSNKPPAAAEVQAGSGTVDLQYAVPAGWTETKKTGVTVIEASKADFYTNYRWTLMVMPSQALKGSLRDNFHEYWKDLIKANYESDVVPLPLTTRLDDGYVCAFDVDKDAKHRASGAKPRTVSVYLVAHGDRFVPVMVITYGYEKQLDTDLDQFMRTARIPGSSSAKIQLFDEKDIVGDWSEGSSSIASYVTSSGGYAGDASIYTGSGFDLRKDGTYLHVFMALSGGTRIKERDEGTWSIDDDELVLKQAKGDTRYSLLGYSLDPSAGRFLVLGTYANVRSKLSMLDPRGPFQASWFKAK